MSVVKNYEVVIRARMNNPAAADPTLVATASAATCTVEAIVINGVEKNLTGNANFVAGELTTLTAAVKAAVVDYLDNV